VIRRALAAAALGLVTAGAVACGGETAAPGTAGAFTDGGSTASPAPERSRLSPAAPAAGAAIAASPASAAARPLAGKVIVIDPGHNGNNWRAPEKINKKVNAVTMWKPCDTTGTTTNDGYPESAFAWDVATRLAKLLRAQGATVKLTRKDNKGVGPCITERAAIANRAKADASISIHADGAGQGTRGFHVIVPKKINGPVDPVVGDSLRLGVAIRNAVREVTGLPYANYIGKNGIDRRGDLGGLNLSTVPKVFLETGNMRNPTDARKMKDPAFRQRLAEALAKGLRDYLSR